MSILASSWNRRSKPLDLQINVFNRQRRHAVDRQALVRFLERAAIRLEIEAGFSVVLVSDRAMRRFNKDFAGRNRPTDVLSFPAARSGWADEPGLGDIIISVERAEAQRPGPLSAELQRLALHGLLHLLGYDHAVDGGRMRTLEKRLRREFGLA